MEVNYHKSSFLTTWTKIIAGSIEKPEVIEYRGKVYSVHEREQRTECGDCDIRDMEHLPENPDRLDNCRAMCPCTARSYDHPMYVIKDDKVHPYTMHHIDMYPYPIKFKLIVDDSVDVSITIEKTSEEF